MTSVPVNTFCSVLKIHSYRLFHSLPSHFSWKNIYTNSVWGNPFNNSMANPQLQETITIWNKTFRSTPMRSYPGILSFFFSLLSLAFRSFLTSSFMMRVMSASAAAIRPPLIHSTMSLGKYEDELVVFLSASFTAPLPLSLPDIKSTVIRLLLNLWWPRHLTAELHQWWKNTESKWGCNSSGVGPWPLIELKDIGNSEKERHVQDDWTQKVEGGGWREEGM